MEESRFRVLWNDDSLLARDVVLMSGLGPSGCRRLAKSLGLPSRTAPSSHGRSPRKRDPTPQEIREACQRIRAAWTWQERERRSVGQRGRWLCPIISRI